jgi:hypothetical protein
VLADGHLVRGPVPIPWGRPTIVTAEAAMLIVTAETAMLIKAAEGVMLI